MKSFLVICLAFAVAQAAPADEFQYEFQNAISNSKLQPMFQSAADEAKQNADSFMQQYQGVSKDIKNTLAEFPDEVFTKTFKSTADKIKSYSKSLEPMMNDPNTSPEDKAHQVVSSITPLLDSILSDFQNAADVIENYLGDANPVLQDGASNMADSANNIMQRLASSLQKYSEQAKPEVSSLFDALNKDLTKTQGQVQKQFGSNLADLQSKINSYEPQSAQIPQVQY